MFICPVCSEGMTCKSLLYTDGAVCNRRLLVEMFFAKNQKKALTEMNIVGMIIFVADMRRQLVNQL